MPIGPDDVGRRVVLRHRLPDGRATDVLGELVSWPAAASTEHAPGAAPGGGAGEMPGEVVVATSRGPVRVRVSDVLLGKVVPPAPVRRSRRTGRTGPSNSLNRLSVTELHDVMADGWQPLEREDYGGWRLRAAEGFTGRANSVLPLGAPPDPLPDAVDRVEAWYAERSLPGRFCIPWELGAGPDERGGPGEGDDPLDHELVRRGYRLDTPTLVLTRSTYAPGAAPPAESGSARLTAATAGAAGAALGDYTVVVRDEPDEGFLSLYRYRGQDLPAVAATVMTSAPAQAFVSLRRADTGRTVAVGRVAGSRGWSGVSAVEVADDYRRRGLAGVVMAELLDWAARRGDHSVYLQVARDNAPARALYDGLGFSAHSGYHYRIQPG